MCYIHSATLYGNIIVHFRTKKMFYFHLNQSLINLFIDFYELSKSNVSTLIFRGSTVSENIISPKANHWSWRTYRWQPFPISKHMVIDLVVKKILSADNFRVRRCGVIGEHEKDTIQKLHISNVTCDILWVYSKDKVSSWKNI